MSYYDIREFYRPKSVEYRKNYDAIFGVKHEQWNREDAEKTGSAVADPETGSLQGVADDTLEQTK